MNSQQLRAWFAPKWERFWTLTPYDRLVLGLPLDDAAERLELQTLKELAYRPPLESDVFWQRSNYVGARTCFSPGENAISRFSTESGMDVPTVGAYGDGRIIDQTWTMPRKPS